MIYIVMNIIVNVKKARPGGCRWGLLARLLKGVLTSHLPVGGPVPYSADADHQFRHADHRFRGMPITLEWSGGP